VTGNPGDDTFSEGGGPDGADTIRGGTGFDTVDYGQRGAPLEIRLGSSLGDGEAGGGHIVGPCPLHLPAGRSAPLPGRLTLSDPAQPGRILGSARYTLALGTSGSVRVPLSAAERAALRRRHLTIVRTTEGGHSGKGPRRTLFRLGVS
jgi:hypothetical protein